MRDPFTADYSAERGAYNQSMDKRRFLLLLFLAPALLAQSPGLAPEKIRRIEQAVSAEMTRGSIPGASVAVAIGGELRWAAGFGLADLENQVPVTSATRIRLGSISKPITAVAVLQLVERGKIDLDAEIQRYAPAFPRKQWPVTIRQLLGHLGGIRHYNGMPEVDSTVHYDDRVTPLKIFQADPLLAQPGTRYAYTTYGFNLLGAAVEGASDFRFLDYLRDNVFRPAGMGEIGADDVYEIIPRRARGYRLRDGHLENCALADTSNKIPGGGMISTASDLVKFGLAVGSGKLVKKDTARLMFTRQTTSDGKPTSYGMGFFVSQFEGRERVGHGGGQQGISTHLSLFPAEGVALAIMVNLEGARTLGAMTDAVARILLEN